MITIANLLLNGVLGCASTEPPVPPEVLAAACRLLACIDDARVVITCHDNTATLVYRDHGIAQLSEQVPGYSVRTVLSCGFDSPTEQVIVRGEPIDLGWVANAREQIKHIDKYPG